MWVRLLGWVSFLITKPIPPHLLYCNHPFIYIKVFSLLIVHSCFIFTMFLFILCVYLNLYFNIHIIVLGYYYCVGYPRWVLDHLLSYVREVPLGGSNPIPLRHLGILLLLFSFLSSHLLSSNPHFLLISCRFPLPLYFIALIYIYIYICMYVCMYVCMYIIFRHLKKRFSTISLK